MSETKANYLFHDEEYKKLIENNFDGWGAESLSRRVDGFTRDFNKIVEHPSTPKAPCHVLELGCGAGNMTSVISSKGYHVTGVDISQTAIDWAKKRFSESSCSAKFVCQDIRDLSCFQSESFDFAIDTACLHCIIGEDDRCKVFSEIRKVLKKEAFLFLGSMVEEPKVMLDNRRYDPKTKFQFKNGFPYRYMSSEEDLEKEIKFHGFEIVTKWINKNPSWDHCNMLLQKRT